jgi:hypothetical protein
MEIVLGPEDIEVSTQNAFGFEKPETYSCRVWKYIVSHSALTIEVKSKHTVEKYPKHFYIIFEPTDYFQGPVWWKGADFRTASQGECFSLLYAMHTGRTMEEDGLPDPAKLSGEAGRRLFIAEYGKIEVKILAGLVIITDNLPDIFGYDRYHPEPVGGG